MANKLIQWNCRGLKANFNELLLLLTGLCLSIICLQDTFLNPSGNLNIRGYNMFNHIYQSGDRASGGSSIVVNNSIPQSQIQLNTNIQAVAVKVTLHKTIHVNKRCKTCNILGTDSHFTSSLKQIVLYQTDRQIHLFNQYVTDYLKIIQI